MSSRKFFAGTANYSELFKRCPINQLPNLRRLKARNRSYVEKVNSLPEGLPTIDWEYYKSNVREEYLNMVEEFQMKYAEFKVPYPEDLYAGQLDEMEKEIEKEICQYKAESDSRIENYERQVCKILDTIPFEEMTMEDFIDAFPDQAPDFINKPTFWPHTPDEQIQSAQPEQLEPLVEVDANKLTKSSAKMGGEIAAESVDTKAVATEKLESSKTDDAGTAESSKKLDDAGRSEMSKEKEKEGSDK